MKTTNYEISKRLHELVGYDSYITNFSDRIWSSIIDHVTKEQKNLLFESLRDERDYMQSMLFYHLTKVPISSYSLESIINILPKQHKFGGNINYGLRIWFEEGSSYVGYQMFDGFHKLFTFETQNDESLADTAGRLLIKLIEEGIVKVGENRLKKSIEQLESGKVIRKSLNELKTEFKEGNERIFGKKYKYKGNGSIFWAIPTYHSGYKIRMCCESNSCWDIAFMNLEDMKKDFEELGENE